MMSESGMFPLYLWHVPVHLGGLTQPRPFLLRREQLVTLTSILLEPTLSSPLLHQPQHQPLCTFAVHPLGRLRCREQGRTKLHGEHLAAVALGCHTCCLCLLLWAKTDCLLPQAALVNQTLGSLPYSCTHSWL